MFVMQVGSSGVVYTLFDFRPSGPDKPSVDFHAHYNVTVKGE